MKKSFATELGKSSQDFAASGNVLATFAKALPQTAKLSNFQHPAGRFATGSPENKRHRLAKSILFYVTIFTLCSDLYIII